MRQCNQLESVVGNAILKAPVQPGTRLRCLQAFVLLSQKVLLHSRLTTMMLKRMPKEAGKWLGWVGRWVGGLVHLCVSAPAGPHPLPACPILCLLANGVCG